MKIDTKEKRHVCVVCKSKRFESHMDKIHFIKSDGALSMHSWVCKFGRQHGTFFVIVSVNLN